MSAPAPLQPCVSTLRPELSAYFAIRRVFPTPLERIDAPTRGILAELARHGRP
jgi:hypothetical protein